MEIAILHDSMIVRNALAGLTCLVLAFALAVSPAAQPLSGDRQPVDLELVLAVDTSGSIDDAEFRLQMDGVSAAFRDPEIQRAATSGPLGRMAVSLLTWADASLPADRGPWFLISGPADAELFAAHVARRLRVVSGGTGLGAGLSTAVDMIDRNGYAGTVRRIDVSGDGRETPPRDFVVMVQQGRARAIRRSVTVSALAIRTDDPDLAAYYAAEVAVGPGSFVMAVDDFRDFGAAIRAKLLREIEYRPTVSAVP